MATNRRFEIEELFPQPKEVILGEGISELAADVRLSTNNVYPIQRKALRSILTMGGVRVVANKKTYVVDAQVCGPEAFDLSRVPENVRHDYYELEIRGSEVFLRTPFQEGMVWAAQTLSLLFGMMFRGRAVPNLVIRDWPMVPYRGILMDADWGTERMANTEWFQAIDAMSAMHLNLLGFGIYDCRPNVRTSQNSRPSEFLLANVHTDPGANEPASKSRLRFYNVKYDRWYDHDVSPVLAEGDNFDEVLIYARERGLTLFPMMNLMGRSTLLPRLIPALSACDEKGKPTKYGLCLSSSAARKALEEFIGSFLDRYYPDGVEYFHLGFDDLSDIQPHAGDNGFESVWCRCAKCRKLSQATAFAKFLEWVVGFLSEKGVKKVVFYSNELLCGRKLLGSELTDLLKQPEFASKVVIDWEDPAGESAGKYIQPTDPRFGLVESWLTPRMNFGNYASFSRNFETVDAAVAQSLKEGCAGVMVRGEFDPAYLEQLAVFGVRCWETPAWKEDTIDELRKRWASLQWSQCDGRYLDALDRLAKLSDDPIHQRVLTWKYLQVTNEPGASVTPAYPGAALEALAASKTTAAQIQALADKARGIVDDARDMLASYSWDNAHRASLQSLAANGARVRIQLLFFVTLLNVKSALEKKSGGYAAAIKLLDDALPELVANLKIVEENLFDGVMWIAMQQLSCQKLYFETLREALREKTPLQKLAWTLPISWEAPEDK